MDGSPESETCPGCGLVLPVTNGSSHPYLGASAACWGRFEQILEREYSNPAYMAAHQTTVNAYAAQHPGQENVRTIQSINVHLAGLHLVFEQGSKPDYVQYFMGILARVGGDFCWLVPPGSLGDVNVLDVLNAQSPRDHGEEVRRWGEAVWRAWSPHHETIRRLVAAAMPA